MHLLSVLDCGMTPCEEKFQIQVWLGFGLVLHFWSFLYPLLCRSKILQSHLGSVALVCDRLRLARRNAPLAMWPKSMVMMTGYCIASRKSWHQQPFDVPGPTVPWVKIKSERERERWQQKLLNCRDKDFSPIWPYIMNEVIARLIETAMTGEATYLLLSLCPSSLHPGQSLAASFGRYTTCPGTGSLIRRREWCSHNMSQYGTICQNPIQSIHPDSLSMEGFGRPFFSVFLVWVFQPRPAPEGAVDITLLAVF